MTSWTRARPRSSSSCRSRTSPCHRCRGPSRRTSRTATARWSSLSRGTGASPLTSARAATAACGHEDPPRRSPASRVWAFAEPGATVPSSVCGAMAGIFLRAGEIYVALHERPYDAESVLQELIERHPQMLAGDDSAHGPLLLVKREAGVSDREDGGARWSLDHLYLDGDGVPTLVEVKRSSDKRARREVVAQMLDYAANASSSFNVERLGAWVAEDAERRGATVDDVLREALGVEDAEEFWAQVA